MLADDFQFNGPVPELINKDAWIGMNVSLKTAFPDLNYHYKVIGTAFQSVSHLMGRRNLGTFDIDLAFRRRPPGVT